MTESTEPATAVTETGVESTETPVKTETVEETTTTTTTTEATTTQTTTEEDTGEKPSEGTPAVKPKKVLFLNCHLFGHSFVGRLWPPLSYRDDSRAAAIAEHIARADADVVVLAEVWGAKLIRRIAEDPQVKAVLPHSWCDPRSASPVSAWRRVMGSGMVLLSREPIAQEACTEYRALSGWDAWARKCVFTALCGDVLVGGTHVEAEGDAAGCRCRDDNVAQVVEHVRAAAARAGTDRVVLAGDFNTAEYASGAHDRTRPEYDRLRASLAGAQPPLRDALRVVAPCIRDAPGVTSDHKDNSLTVRWQSAPSDEKIRLDYFFVSHSVNVVDCTVLSDWKDPSNGDDVSDHYGISLLFN